MVNQHSGPAGVEDRRHSCRRVQALDATQTHQMVGLAASRNPHRPAVHAVVRPECSDDVRRVEPVPQRTLGTAYFVPYLNRKNRDKPVYECQLIVGYRGMCTLARRSGEIVSIQAEVVRDGDEFELGTDWSPIFRHKPKGDTSSPCSRCGRWPCSRAVAADGGDVARRNRSGTRSKPHRERRTPPWVTDPR